MKLSIKNISCVLLIVSILLIAIFIPSTIYASAKTVDGEVDNAVAVADVQQDAVEQEQKVESSVTQHKAWAAAIVVGLAAAAGAIGMAMVIAKAVGGIARQPEADGKIRTTLMLGLVFIETAIIYALIVAILIIFVM